MKRTKASPFLQSNTALLRDMVGAGVLKSAFESGPAKPLKDKTMKSFQFERRVGALLFKVKDTYALISRHVHAFFSPIYSACTTSAVGRFTYRGRNPTIDVTVRMGDAYHTALALVVNTESNACMTILFTTGTVAPVPIAIE